MPRTSHWICCLHQFQKNMLMSDQCRNTLWWVVLLVSVISLFVSLPVKCIWNKREKREKREKAYILRYVSNSELATISISLSALEGLNPSSRAGKYSLDQGELWLWVEWVSCEDTQKQVAQTNKIPTNKKKNATINTTVTGKNHHLCCNRRARRSCLMWGPSQPWGVGRRGLAGRQ